ncbi:hypothetical protein FHL15_000970 [Xylaria flabelliformis]|uniref:Uncharacterized protein n=1 Tax=Xylaria flabelliformis TaxID=2512241 RepID=A0A553IDP3_9PEZI|nr:hypothetical protein FHL15_000970 [Xylaria flabelliformis]
MSTSTGPSPSLWPEPARPIPAAPRRVQFYTKARMHDAASTSVDGASDKQQGSVHTEDAAPSSDSMTPRMESGTVILSSSSATTACPSLRPIDVAVPNIFEPTYPRWFSYPPILPTKFETKTPINYINHSLFDPTDIFLQQSSAFQSWINKKNAERIQLRHGPAYEKLVNELHKYQCIANHGPTPAARADARQIILEIEAAQIEERKKFSAAELQYIRAIEKAWVSFVSIDNQERAIPKQYQMCTTLQVKPERSLSKVERLLGSDGSSLGTPSQNQLYGGVGVDSMDLGGRHAKTTAPNLYEKLPLPADVGTWPDKPYEVLIPDWFPVAEAQGIIDMKGLSCTEGIVKNHNWNKRWHPPNPGWRHEHQKTKGGWWKCHKGPAGTAAENKCKLCPDIEISNPTPPAQVLDRLMNDIKEAMAIVGRNDKNEILSCRSSNRRPTDVEVFRQLDEDVKMWALEEGSLAAVMQSGTISLGAREPWINYNPLQGLDDSPGTATTAQAYTQQAAGENEERRISCDEDAGKENQVS